MDVFSFTPEERVKVEKLFCYLGLPPLKNWQGGDVMLDNDEPVVVGS